MSRGGRLRRFHPSRAQREAAELLDTCTIDGVTPSYATDLNTIIAFLRINIDVSGCAGRMGIGLPAIRGSLARRVAQLTDIASSVAGLQRLLTARDTVQ
jgi:hypothetical protein